MTIGFDTIKIANNCESPVFLTGMSNPGGQLEIGRLEPQTEVLFKGTEPFLPVKPIQPAKYGQRIEASFYRSGATTPPDEIELSWVELSANLESKAVAAGDETEGWGFAAKPAINFATQVGMTNLGIEVALLDRDGNEIVDRPTTQGDTAPFARARIQPDVDECSKACAAQQACRKEKSAHFLDVCRPYCPNGQFAQPMSAAATYEGCVLQNRPVPYGAGATLPTYYAVDETMFNAYAKYGSDSACAFRQGEWVSAPRTTTTRKNYLDGASQREFDPNIHTRGLPANWSPNFECWDNMGTGPDGFPLVASDEEWANFSQLEVTFCPARVLCKRPGASPSPAVIPAPAAGGDTAGPGPAIFTAIGLLVVFSVILVIVFAGNGKR
jgi:hypothetical protein